ncbi:MAG: hypothetical protein NVSMB12_08370 [Acidimicrobiales bacterium]
MRAVVIYESLTGNTRKAAGMIARQMTAQGVETVACPITAIDYQALSGADLVIVGSWTDGVFVVGQRPGRAHRLRALPSLAGKRAVVYCTYAINPGRTLDKMTSIIEGRGAQVIGGMAIRRTDLEGGAEEFAGRLVAAVEA